MLLVDLVVQVQVVHGHADLQGQGLHGLGVHELQRVPHAVVEVGADLPEIVQVAVVQGVEAEDLRRYADGVEGAAEADGPGQLDPLQAAGVAEQTDVQLPLAAAGDVVRPPR